MWQHWHREMWGKGGGRQKELENCSQFAGLKAGVTRQEKRECPVAIKFCYLVTKK